MFDTVSVDIRRYMRTEDVDSLGGLFELFIFNYSLWVVISYRFGVWVRHDFNIPILKQLLKLITRVEHELLCLITGIYIRFETNIGPGLYIGHTGMLVVNSHAIIGSHCTLSVGVVIGQAGRGERRGCPTIGNDVYVGVGAKIIGKITVGDGSAIGANAVVTRDIPPHATAVGVPARVINTLGSKDYIPELD